MFATLPYEHRLQRLELDLLPMNELMPPWPNEEGAMDVSLVVVIIPNGDLSLARAYWVNKSLLAWNLNIEHAQFYLFASKNANLNLTAEGVKGEDLVIQLEQDRDGLPTKVTEKFPHIAHYKALKLPVGVDVKDVIKCQLAIACIDGKEHVNCLF
eukprot:Gb_39233 [translate_table: standard]